MGNRLPQYCLGLNHYKVSSAQNSKYWLFTHLDSDGDWYFVSADQAWIYQNSRGWPTIGSSRLPLARMAGMISFTPQCSFFWDKPGPAFTVTDMFTMVWQASKRITGKVQQCKHFQVFVYTITNSSLSKGVHITRPKVESVWQINIKLNSKGKDARTDENLGSVLRSTFSC
jgi:hypothetical protein